MKNLPLFILVIVVMGGFIHLCNNTKNSSQNYTENISDLIERETSIGNEYRRRLEIYQFAKSIVTSEAHSYRQAEIVFPDCIEHFGHVIQVDSAHYVVDSYYWSSNSYGAITETTFYCEVVFDKNRGKVLKNLKME